jgi:hypothetical protein
MDPPTINVQLGKGQATAIIVVGLIAVVYMATRWNDLPHAVVIGVIALVLIIVVGSLAVFVKHPKLRMEDEALLDYQREFENFHPDATQHSSSQPTEPSELDALRIEEYERNCGLFLVHSWRPSKKQGQVADLIVRLAEHIDTSTRRSVLNDRKVESVRYALGRKFFEEPVLKRNRRDDFALEVSAYRPMLCVAEVRFNDGHPPVYLSRYIDFPTDS